MNWHEMRIQEKVDEQEPLGMGQSYGEGVELPSRRPIGFRREVSIIVENGKR